MIRKVIIEADLVDCMVALPGQLFYSMQIPVCLWFLACNKSGLSNGAAGAAPGGCFCDRRGETPSIDAHKRGTMADRVHRELLDADIAKIAGTFHAWRVDPENVGRVSPSGRNPTDAASVNPPPSTISASTATSSRQAVTSAPRRPRMMASCSRKRCGGLPVN